MEENQTNTEKSPKQKSVKRINHRYMQQPESNLKSMLSSQTKRVQFHFSGVLDCGPIVKSSPMPVSV